MSGEVIPEFYGNFPFIGVPLGRQVLPWKDNSRATNTVVQSAFVYANATDRQRDALAYLASGDLTKKLTYRIGYDKDRSVYVIQNNTGTDVLQVWEDVLIIDAGGLITVPGGIATSGFYVSLTFTETDGSPTFNSDRLTFNSSSFYLTPDSTGRPILNFRGSSGSGDVTNASNVGAGSGVFAQKNGTVLEFKSLVAGSNITLTPAASSVTIAASAGASSITVKDSQGIYSRTTDTVTFHSNDFYITPDSGGKPVVNAKPQTDRTTASNLGSGSGLFAQKVLDDLQFKGLVAGNNIVLSSTATGVTVTGLIDKFYGITVRESDGSPAYKDINTVTFDRNDFYLGQNGTERDSVVVSWRGDKTTASNLGSGAGLFSSKANDDLKFRSLVQGDGIIFESSTNELRVSGAFYSGVLVRESEAGGFSRRVDRIAFDSNDFYVGPDNKGQAFVASTRNAKWTDLPEKLLTGTYTAVASDKGSMLISIAASTLTLNLTAVASLPLGMVFSVKNNGGGNLTIDPNGAELINGAATLAILPGASAHVWSTGSAWRAIVIRDILSADRDYYVRTDGNDNNSGLVNTAGGALRTIQAAINKCYSVEQNGFSININVGSGTHTSGVSVSARFSGTVSLIGDTVTPANVILSTTNAQGITLSGAGVMLQLRGFDMRTITAGQCLFVTNQAQLRIDGLMIFGACAANHMYASNDGVITVVSNYTINGAPQAHHLSEFRGTINCNNLTITISGTPAWADTFARCRNQSLMQINNNTYSGSATGSRFNVATLSNIYVNGGGATYLPGNALGTTDATTFGVYA